MLAGLKIEKNSKIRGQFYVCTDGDDENFWDFMDKMALACGLNSIKNKIRVPYIVAFNLAKFI